MADSIQTTAPTRLVQPDDRPVLRDVLARAFADDPVISWVFKRESSRPRWAPRFFDWELSRLIPQGTSWTTPDLQGAALWSPPGQWHETVRETLRLITVMAPAVNVRAVEVLRGLTAVERAHPSAPHMYLAILGVDAGQQGTGVGSRLLSPGLAQCDATGTAAYLETATERNLPFYERHGFVITGELQIRKGPRIWQMWRDPQEPGPAR